MYYKVPSLGIRFQTMIWANIHWNEVRLVIITDISKLLFSAGLLVLDHASGQDYKHFVSIGFMNSRFRHNPQQFLK